MAQLLKPRLSFPLSVLPIGIQLGTLPDLQLTAKSCNHEPSPTDPLDLSTEIPGTTQPSCQVGAEVLAEVAEVQNKATRAVVVAPGMLAVPLKVVEKIWAGKFSDYM